MTSDRTKQPILALDRVSLPASLGSALLLDNISFQVDRGEFLALVGASGAGKTSLLRILNRLATSAPGEIYFKGTMVTEISPIELRRQIVLVPQEPKLLGLNSRDAIAYPLELQSLPATEINQIIDTWTERLQIPDSWLEKNELQLSLGQRQLITIARALVMQPQILLLDEPTSALDIGIARNLLTVLSRLNRETDLTIFMVNHQLDLISQFCDRILYLETGKLVKDVPATPEIWQEITQRLIEMQQKSDREWS